MILIKIHYYKDSLLLLMANGKTELTLLIKKIITSK